MSTTLRSFGLGASVEEVLTEEGDRFSVSSFQLGEPVSYEGPPEAVFRDAAGAPLATVRLNPDWRRTLLIWMDGPSNRYGVIALPDDGSSFPKDHIRFVNLTPFRLGILTEDNERRITLPANEWIVDANGREAIRFRAILEKPDGSRPTVSNVVEMRPNVRRTVFFAISNAGEMGGDPDFGPLFSFFVLTDRE